MPQSLGPTRASQSETIGWHPCHCAERNACLIQRKEEADERMKEIQGEQRAEQDRPPYDRKTLMAGKFLNGGPNPFGYARSFILVLPPLGNHGPGIFWEDL
jgi:hypothetical protein